MDYKTIPWSVEETIGHLEFIKKMLQKKVSEINLDGKGVQDEKEVAFDFDRAISALKRNIPKKVKKMDCSQACPECGFPVNGKFCQNCGQAMKY